jgi:hypothetical protein
MSILLPQKNLPDLPQPLWLPAPESPRLPVNELHIWRVSIAEPRPGPADDCPVSRDRKEKMRTALFRQDVLERYTIGAGDSPSIVTGPASGLRVAVARCDHLALIAVSRDVREMGLDVERVREDIPFEEMAGGFLDARSQWDLRITWSPQEKARKFFQFWTSSEACSQALCASRSSQSCHVRGFSPEADFVAALAVEGGPEARVLYWNWQCSLDNPINDLITDPIRYCTDTPAE